jgi:hypothetical protein
MEIVRPRATLPPWRQTKKLRKLAETGAGDLASRRGSAPHENHPCVRSLFWGPAATLVCRPWLGGRAERTKIEYPHSPGTLCAESTKVNCHLGLDGVILWAVAKAGGS